MSDYNRKLYSQTPPFWLVDNPPFPAHEALPTRNGILHLPAYAAGLPGAVIPCTPRFFNLHAVDWLPDESGPPERFLQFLEEVFPGDPDSILLLQMWMGYLLTNDTKYQKMLMIVGPPRSGKGTIARLITRMIGECNVCNPTLASLSGRFGLAPLLGKPAAIISDARISGRHDSAVILERILSITGEDYQTVDRKNKDEVTVKLPTRIILLSNEIPRLADKSSAFASRVCLLRMRHSFLGQEDTGLDAALLTEMPRILHWAILGWKLLQEAGRFPEPESSKSDAKLLRDLSSDVSAFLEDQCVIEPGARVICQRLYAMWQSWNADRGRNSIAPIDVFGRDLTAACAWVVRSQQRVQEADLAPLPAKLTRLHTVGERAYFYEGIRPRTQDDATEVDVGSSAL